jgi:hypothetical protein
MTTGERLVDISTLTTGTAMDHFLNIDTGSGTPVVAYSLFAQKGSVGIVPKNVTLSPSWLHNMPVTKHVLVVEKKEVSLIHAPGVLLSDKSSIIIGTKNVDLIHFVPLEKILIFKDKIIKHTNNIITYNGN